MYPLTCLIFMKIKHTITSRYLSKLMILSFKDNKNDFGDLASNKYMLQMNKAKLYQNPL